MCVKTDAIRTESKESVSYGNWNFTGGESASDLMVLDVDASKVEMLKRDWTKLEVPDP